MILLELFLFIFGLVWGSFLNVLIFRYRPDQKYDLLKIISGRSRCPYCKKELLKKDLIPVLSFFLLKGKCRFCQKRISFIYPLVEFLSAIFTPLIFIKTYPNLFLFLLWFLIFSNLLVLSFIDLRFLCVPNQLLNLFLLLSLILVFFQNSPSHYFWNVFPQFDFKILNHLFGGIIFGLPLWLFSQKTKEKFLGFGDVKVIATSSFLFGWPKAILVFNLSFLLGGIGALISMLFFKKSFHSKLPFLPFLALAIFLTFFLEDQILNLYLSFFEI